jgi:hypothetical protein
MKTYTTLGVTRILLENCARVWWRRFDPNEGLNDLDERGHYEFGRKPRYEEANGKRELVFEMTSEELQELIYQLTGSYPEVQT